MKNVWIYILLVVVLNLSSYAANESNSLQRQGNALSVYLTKSADSGRLVKLAAKEIDRYTWLRTGDRAAETKDSNADIVLAIDASLGPDEFTLRTENSCLTISGGSELAVLYGAYRYAELLGVRFYIHGDVIPDGKIPFALPRVDETHKPLFDVRGILPFHDFTVGPDWAEKGVSPVFSHFCLLS